MVSNAWPLFWFVVILAAIPLALWLLKRSPYGAARGFGGPQTMRNIATLALSPSQRLVTVEVGDGDERRWLVLGVTPQQISMLHTLMPPTGPSAPAATAPTVPFAQLFSSLRKDAPGGNGAR